MNDTSELFDSDTGWVVTSRGSCYSRSRRVMKVKDGVTREQIDQFVDEEKSSWYGQDFWKFDKAWPIVELERAVDSSG